MLNPSAVLISRFFKPLVFFMAFLPFVFMLIKVIENELGADPIKTLTHQTGDLGLYFLLITLSISPLRNLLHAPWLIRFRRMLGLFAFFYAVLHVAIYFGLDQQLLVNAIIEDIVKRPYITVGFCAFLILLALAATSFKAAQRRMGKNWKKLHKTVYLATALVLLHYLWLVKADLLLPLIYTAVYLLLLAGRLPSLSRK